MMAKKEDLKNSFGGGSRRRNKPILSDAEINKIAEEREKIKKGVNPKGSVEKPVKSKPVAAKPKPVANKSTPKAPVKAKKLKRVVQEGDEPVIKTSLDMPVSLYEEMKIHLIRQKKSMREYLLDMIKTDLAKNSK